MSQTPLDRLRHAFRMGPTPKRVADDAAMHGGFACPPTARQVIAYVRHNYTNYERVCKQIPHSPLDYHEFKTWVNGQIEAVISEKSMKRD